MKGERKRMKILIVDDEPRHLRGMVAMIRTMRPDASVLTAKDGEAALATMRDECPDVVLSDIQMPNMDGLAFLRRLDEEGNQAKVVMVSAYDLFKYAQTALRHGAYDYLLKPVDTEKVEALLDRLDCQLTAEQKERASSEELKQRLGQASSAYRIRLLHRWLGGKLRSDERAGLSEWSTLHEVNVLVLTEFVSWDAEFGDESRLQLLAEQLDSTGAVFGEACTFSLQTEPNSGTRFITALKLVPPTPETRRALREALQVVTEAWHTQGTLSFGIASLSPDDKLGEEQVKAVPRLYQEAKRALEYSFHGEWRGVIDAEEVLPPAKPIYSLDGEHLFEALLEPETSVAEAMCVAAFRELAACGRIEPRLMKEYATLILMKLKSRTRGIVDLHIGSVINEVAISSVPSCRSSEALMDLMLGCLRTVHKSLHERRQSSSELAVDQCLSWIQERHSEDLTLEMAAERFHFNASYFSTLLKARTGRSFSEHVTDVRIRRA